MLDEIRIEVDGSMVSLWNGGFEELMRRRVMPTYHLWMMRREWPEEMIALGKPSLRLAWRDTEVLVVMYLELMQWTKAKSVGLMLQRHLAHPRPSVPKFACPKDV